MQARPLTNDPAALRVQMLKRLAAGLATRAELRAIRAEERAASPRGLHALKSGRARL